MKVELARSGAWSDGGGVVSVDSSLNYKFYHGYLGKGGVPTSKYYIGKTDRQFWDTLNRKLEAVNYKSIPEKTFIGGADINYFELIVTLRGDKKRIVRERRFDSTDSTIESVFEWLNNSYKNVHLLKEVKGPIKFETTYQAGGYEADEKKLIEDQAKSSHK